MWCLTNQIVDNKVATVCLRMCVRVFFLYSSGAQTRKFPSHTSCGYSTFCNTITQTNTNFLAFLGDATNLPDTAKKVAHHPVKLGGLGVRDYPMAAKTAYVISLTRSLHYAAPPHNTQSQHTTPHISPAHARPLTSWAHPKTTHRLFRLYQALAPQVIQALQTIKPTKPPLTTTKQLHTDTPLPGLASAIYTHHSTEHLKAHLDNAPPDTKALTQALLTDITSLPLCSYNRRFEDNRLDNEVFQVLLQRKLRLPLPLPPTPCIHCKKAFDPYGDHLFRCKYSKKTLRDNLRDTVYTLCTNLAPMAGFVHTKHAVSCETGNLLPDYPGKRPADVGLCLCPSAIPSNPPHPVHFLAINITATSPPQLDDTPAQPQLPATAPDTEPPRPAHKPNPITKAHLDYLRLKLSRSQQVNNPEYFQALLDNKIMLLPFTVDPFGGLGTHAHAFLYGTNKDTPNTPPSATTPQLARHSQINPFPLQNQRRNMTSRG
jgi:hypothetical protein